MIDEVGLVWSRLAVEVFAESKVGCIHTCVVDLAVCHPNSCKSRDQYAKRRSEVYLYKAGRCGGEMKHCYDSGSYYHKAIPPQ
jgi:hypothetical protein